MDYLNRINKEKLPKHVAIVTDGNGRWARQHGRDRVYGHHKGVDAVRKIMKAAATLGIKYLTLYTFSTENWNRPKEEVDALMELFLETIEKEIPTLNKNNIRLFAIGDIDRLPEKNREKLLSTIERTSHNDKMTMTLAISYGSRWEIIQAAKKISIDYKDGKVDFENFSDEEFSNYMATAGIPDPELVIRTSGEQRISNFLLWQIAYSELYFSPKYWPAFSANDLYKAILEYQNRERRFGLTSEQLKFEERNED